MFRTSKTEGSMPSPGPEVGGDNAGGGGGAGGEGGVFLAHLEGGGEDRVRRQVVDILR
jgi:hypothetical protein